MSVPEIGHLKKDIKKEDCLDQSLYISMIQLKNAVYPVTVTWDNSLFNDPCRINSIITDWHPVGWFDAIVGSSMPQNLVELKNNAPDSFSYTSIHNINSNQDTLDVLFLALGNQNQVFVGLDELGSALSIYPNPASTTLQIDGISAFDQVSIIDFQGNLCPTPRSENMLTIESLTPGAYLIRVTNDERNFYHRFIKQ